MKNLENKGFLPIPKSMGQSVPGKTPGAFQIANKINGFIHISYGSALKQKAVQPRMHTDKHRFCGKKAHNTKAKG